MRGRTQSLEPRHVEGPRCRCEGRWSELARNANGEMHDVDDLQAVVLDLLRALVERQ